MTPHPRFDEIRVAAIAALGTPDDDIDDTPRVVHWPAVMLYGTSGAVYFVHRFTHGSWFIVDETSHGPTVTLSDALNALRPLVTR